MKLGFAFCGSFCNHAKVLDVYEKLCANYEVVPILSENAAALSTRFGEAEQFLARVQSAAKRRAVRTIIEAEQEKCDCIAVAPCTGNTLAKIALGMTDATVPMAVKGHLRNEKPLVIALATNDGLGASAQNIASLLMRKSVYFVPFGQDDPYGKPRSLIADFTLLGDTIAAAVEGRQIQPLLCGGREKNEK